MLLAVIITAIAFILLLAFVPGFDHIYTWLKPGHEVTVGITLNTKNDTIKSLADALNGFISAVLETMCPNKDELLGMIDLLPAPSHNAPDCDAQLDESMANFEKSPLGKDPTAKDAFRKLLLAFSTALCSENRPDRDKAVSMMKAMVEAVC